VSTPYDPTQTAQILAAKDGPFSQLRTGTVVSFTANVAVVSVGGSDFEAAYLQGTTLTVGALVAVLRQDGSWLILGRLAGVGANLLANGNPSFEDSPPGSFPQDWFFANITDVSVPVVEEQLSAPDGTQVASVASSTGAASVSYLYSEPINVTAGDQFTVSAFAGGGYSPTDLPEADAAVVALWFANNTNLYPTTSSADIVIASVTDLVEAPPYTTIGGTVTAPVTGFMRIALRSSVKNSERVLWDQVITRAVT
jgi:hypothetical protein